MSGHKTTISNNKMKLKEDADLVKIVESGSLSHAAARYELSLRGKSHLAQAADLKFLHSMK